MPDVISLCDSDSDEDKLPSCPAQEGMKVTALKDVVDLLGDSSSDEEGLATAANKGESSKTSAFVMSNSISSKDLATAAMSSKRRRSHDKKTAAVVTRPCDDSDSDSDDSILNYESGLTWKKKPYEASAQLSRSSSEFKIATPTRRDSSALTNISTTIPAKKVSPDSSPANLETSTSKHKRCDSKVQPSQSKTQSDNSVLAGNSMTAFPTPRGTIINPYAKTKNGLASHSTNPTTLPKPSCSIPREDLSVVQYPDLLPGSQSCPDIRPKLILALWKRAKTLVNFSHDGKKLDNTVKKIVSLALSEYPLRSLDEYLARYFGVGGVKTTSGRIQRQEGLTTEDLDKLSTPVDACRDGRYFSIVEAGLVAVLEEMELQLRAKNVSLALDDHNVPSLSKHLADKDTWMSLEHLIPAVDQRLKLECPGTLSRRNFLDHGAAHYMDPSTRSAEFLQLKNLLKTPKDADQPFLKQHTRAGQTLFEMTLLGYQTAMRIRSRHFPEPPGHYRCCNLSSVHPRYENICLGVDVREGGGPASVLHIMCNKLDTLKMPYCVGTLSIGDYVFFSGNRLCPILVERKSIQDIAQSIHDGRWVRQKQRMYHGQYVFGYDNSRIAFVIEGKPEAQQVTGGYIGHRMFNVDRQRLDEEIENLEREGFEVMRTMSPENSMVELSRWAQRVAQDVRDGKLAIKYTYEEFESEVQKLPKTTDFSRLAKDAMATRLECAQSVAEVDDDIKVVDPPIQAEAGTGTKKEADQKLSSKKARTGCHSPPKSFFSATTKKEGLIDYSKCSLAALQKQCVEYGLTKTGTKAVLVERLNGPHPPKVWLERKQRKKFVPTRHDSCATAILVGLYLHERDHGKDDDYVGMTKEELYTQAETLDISEEPFSGGNRTGPYDYDGWSSMTKLIHGEDPALVTKKKGRFKLTRSCSIAGYPLAEALHEWCHQHNNCKCGDL